MLLLQYKINNQLDRVGCKTKQTSCGTKRKHCLEVHGVKQSELQMHREPFYKAVWLKVSINYCINNGPS
jgi:hypothetical protein